MSDFSAEQYSCVYFLRLSSFIGCEDLSSSINFPQSENRTTPRGLLLPFSDSLRLLKFLFPFHPSDQFDKSTYIFYDSERFSSSTVKQIIKSYDPSTTSSITVDLNLPSSSTSDTTLLAFLLKVVVESKNIFLVVKLFYGFVSKSKECITNVVFEALQANISSFDGSSFYFLTSNSVLTDNLKIILACQGYLTFEVMHAVGTKPALRMYDIFSAKSAQGLNFIPPYPSRLSPVVYENLNCTNKYLNLALAGLSLSSSAYPGFFVEPHCLDSIVSTYEFESSPILAVTVQAGFSAESEVLLGLLEANILTDLFIAFNEYKVNPILLVSMHPKCYNSLDSYSKLLSEHLQSGCKVKFLNHFGQGLFLCDHFVSFDSSTAWDASLASVPVSIFQDGASNSLYSHEMLASINHPESLDDSSLYPAFVDSIVMKSMQCFERRSKDGLSLYERIIVRRKHIRASYCGYCDS